MFVLVDVLAAVVVVVGGGGGGGGWGLGRLIQIIECENERVEQ
jgi:hypothetical protein